MFEINGQPTNIEYWLEPSTMVYPATFFAPNCKEVCQFELGRIKV